MPTFDSLTYNTEMNDVTRILSQIESGDPLAADQLLPLVYDELRKLVRNGPTHGLGCDTTYEYSKISGFFSTDS